VLEVQRRLLAAAAVLRRNRAAAQVDGGLCAIVVPLAALALYVVGGSPGLPAAPLAERIAAARQREIQRQR